MVSSRSGCLIAVLLCLGVAGCGRQSEAERVAEIAAEVEDLERERLAMQARLQPGVESDIGTVAVLLEWIRVSPTRAAEIPSLQQPIRDANAMRREVEVWRRTGEAEVIETVALGGIPGNRVTSRSGHERTGSWIGGLEQSENPARDDSFSVPMVEVASGVESDGSLHLSIRREEDSLPADSVSPRSIELTVGNGTYALADRLEITKKGGEATETILLFVRADGFPN